jgi:hypothetical protein
VQVLPQNPNHEFTGTIPAGIFNLPLVTLVELGNNYFSGELPPEISGDALGLFLVTSNRITGKIPPGIGNLKNLQTLSLEMNRLSGEIPEEICGLKSLARINIRANNISSEIPASIFQRASLT